MPKSLTSGSLVKQRRRLASQIHSSMSDHVAAFAKHFELAEVKSTSPLRLDLFDSDIDLLGEDIDLSAWVQAYDANVGIKVGDTVAVLRLSDYWVAVDVLSDSTVDISTSAALAAHNALKVGVHGIPTLANGEGLLWTGGTWAATNLATQAELDAHAASTGLASHIPAGGVDASMIVDNSVGTAEIGTLPHVRAQRTNQSIVWNTNTMMVFSDADAYDTDAMHDPASNNTKLFAPTGKGGLYRASATIECQAFVGTAAQFGISIVANSGAQTWAQHYEYGLGTTNVIRRTIGGEGLLAAGEFIEVQVYQLDSDATHPARNMNGYCTLSWASD